MAKKLITPDLPLHEQVFFGDERGLRGVTLMNASGTRGTCLLVNLFNAEGKRRGVTTYALEGRDFFTQWERAITHIADYHGIADNDPMYADMRKAAHLFLTRYGLQLAPVVQHHIVMESA